MKPKTTSTWILIADGSEARILEALGKGKGFQERTVSGGHRPPFGSVVDGATPHPVQEERTSATRALEALFASQLGTMLAGYSRNHLFDTLVLIAPAPMLAQLRKMIPTDVREKVVAEIEKDLTKIPFSEISRYLDDVITL
ncbi:MAG: host attachment protein [Proteobacteria bacterium]|nr:host attachment protein [Pseudomonadota bacterium]